MKHIPSGIFRAYDIRGIFGDEIDREVAFRIGASFGVYLRRLGLKKVSVGMDCRHSSPELKDGVIEGLLGVGCEVFDIGLCPTPVLYFSVSDLGLDGGVMVTASHNPPEYNGFKLCVGRKTLFGDQIQEVGRMAERGVFPSGHGVLHSLGDEVDRYVECVTGNVEIDPSLRVAVDSGNGTVGPVILKVFERLGMGVEALFCDMDGSFPNHHPDPVVEENLEFLKNRVLSMGLDVGVGFDGDGDRIGVVANDGSVVPGDMLLLLFAEDILRRYPGSKVVGEVKCSQVLYDLVADWGGVPIMWKTGHSYIKEKLEKEGALLAGEMSGHIFFKDRYFGFDDAIYASLRLLELLSRYGSSLSGLLSRFPRTFTTPEIRVECPDGIKFGVVEEVGKRLSGLGSVVDIDGIRVSFPDSSWALVRASNTQPAIVLRFEAPSSESLEEIRSFVTSLVTEEIGKRGVVCSES